MRKWWWLVLVAACGWGGALPDGRWEVKLLEGFRGGGTYMVPREEVSSVLVVDGPVATWEGQDWILAEEGSGWVYRDLWITLRLEILRLPGAVVAVYVYDRAAEAPPAVHEFWVGVVDPAPAVGVE